jgi:hypothetical protein
MTHVIVRPEKPLARDSDRRASIAVQPGGSAANQPRGSPHSSFAAPPSGAIVARRRITAT